MTILKLMKRILLQTKKISKLALALLMLFLGIACAVKRLQPVPGDYIIENNYIVVRTDSLIVAVRPIYYRSPNGSVDSHYFSLYLQLQNISNKTLRLPLDSFQILADGNQYSPFSVEMLLAAYPAYRSLSWSAMPTDDKDERRLRQLYDEDRRSLLADSIRLQDLLAGGKQSGYLFYDIAAGRAKELEVEVLGKGLRFAK